MTTTESTSPAQAKAREMMAKVAAGQTLFTKAADGTWMIVGPAADVRLNAWVKVTKANGSTRTVVVTWLGVSNAKGGVAYQVATFRPLTAEDIEAKREREDIAREDRAEDAYYRRTARTRCEHSDTDNNGVCYACGHYDRGSDVGRILAR